MSHLLIKADARRIPLADRSVQCVVTSPPYFGLRDYGTPGQIGLEETVSEYIETMVEDRSRKITEASQMAERQREVASLDQQLKVAIRRLPDQKDIPELLSAISNLGRDAGLDILVFRQKPEGYQEFYAEVPVEMQVRGGYHQVAAFVDQVGKLDRIVNVSSIALEEPKVTDDEMLLKASAQVTTFRFLSEPERQRLIKEKKIKGEETR